MQFYERDEELIASAGTYLADALAAGEVAIVAATGPHRAAFESDFEAKGIDIAAAKVAGAYLALDAAETMARFLVGGTPDAAMFGAVVGGLVRRARASGRRVRAYGEMVALLWSDGQVNAAIELEGLWNRLRDEVEFSLYCAYPMAAVADDDHSDDFLRVCRSHSEIVDRCDAVRGFPATAHGATEARHFVVDALTERGRADLLDDAALVVTELAANAALHARSDFTVELSWRGDGCIRIAVRDASNVSPRLRRTEALDTGGRGLRLVAAVSDRWGAQPCAGDRDGKVVWAELRR